MYYACITPEFREQISGQEPAGRIPEVLFVLRLYACTTRANFKPGAGQEDPRGTFLYYACTTLVAREQISSQEPAGGSQRYFLYTRSRPGGSLGYFFALRLYYESKFQVRSRPGGSQMYFLYYDCITLVLREQISGQEPAGRIPGVLFVLRLCYACTTRANFKPGVRREDPRGTFCTTLVLRLYYESKFLSSQEPAGRIQGVLFCIAFGGWLGR